jgi:hypothetical protein
MNDWPFIGRSDKYCLMIQEEDLTFLSSDHNENIVKRNQK